MKEDATIVLGNTSVYENGDYFANYVPVFATVNNTKFEINQVNNSIGSGLSLFRKGNYPSIGNISDRVYGASFFNLNTAQSNIPIIGLSGQAVNPNGLAIGIEGIGRNTGSGPDAKAIGVAAQARNGLENTAVSARADITGGISNPKAYGYIANVTGFSATSAASCYGVFSNVQGSTNTGSLNYAIYGSATGTNNFAGFFNGRIFSTNALVVSDITLKKDIKIEENVFDKLKKLKPVTYNFIRDSNKTGLSLSNKLQHGFIAQELEEVFPELVENIVNPMFNDKSEQIGTQNFKAVNYVGLISILTSSINEMSKKIELLEEKLNVNQKNFVITSSKNFTESELLAIKNNSYTLEQNVPNPFKISTQINYSLPANEKNALILILNLNGQLIKEYKLNEFKGTLIIEDNLLSKGLYLYSLVVNGEEIITKKMVVN